MIPMTGDFTAFTCGFIMIYPGKKINPVVVVFFSDHLFLPIVPYLWSLSVTNE
jgi:hypothetical protein